MTLDGVAYFFPGWTSKTSGTYLIYYNSSPGYEFDHWFTTGWINVTNSTSQATSVAVSGAGNVAAVYKKAIINTDLNNDGTVNIVDVVIVATACESTPGTPKWNATADLDKDGIINIVDVTMVARDY
jgi:hypothetical protein